MIELPDSNNNFWAEAFPAGFVYSQLLKIEFGTPKVELLTFLNNVKIQLLAAEGKATPFPLFYFLLDMHGQL